MSTGIVKFFNDEKGFGFIKDDNGPNDLFVHQSQIRMEGHRSLEEGQRVQFVIEPGQKGPQANDVTVI